MNIHETIIFIHIIYMSAHKCIHRHMYKYIYMTQFSQMTAGGFVVLVAVVDSFVCLFLWFDLFRFVLLFISRAPSILCMTRKGILMPLVNSF